MPEIFRERGYRFFFFSREGNEPRHVHIEKAENYAKFWLDPLELAESRGFRSSDLREIHNLVETHRESIIITWNEHFSQ